MWPFGSNKTKIWKVNNHRVKATTAKKRVGTKHVPAPNNTTDPRPQYKRKTKYECVDCEKTFDDRNRFKEEECYDVIYE